MASLKRSLESDPALATVSSKVYMRSLRSGKVQKIVREVYLRQDIPCSSNLCKVCLEHAPRDARSRRTSKVKEYLIRPSSSPLPPPLSLT